MENIVELIEHPERLDKQTLYELRQLVAQYPYYQAARLLFLQNLYLLHDAQFGEELRKAALLLPDRSVLFTMIEEKNYEIQKKKLQTEEANTAEKGDRTSSLIDDFLLTTDEPTSMPQRRPTAADATNNYAVFLLGMEDAPISEAEGQEKGEDRSEALIDDFIENKGGHIQLSETPDSPPLQPTDTTDNSESQDEGYLTLTLAKIYIKQQRYSKALEIMRKVSTTNPKKSSYFADQIRFLQKLVVNQSHEKMSN